MAEYRISGVWKDAQGTITHYGFHTVTSTGVTRAVKKSKATAIQLLETSGNSATTWVWNYKSCFWTVGENVEVVNASTGKYLRTNPDSKETNNLGHLINYDWLAS
ncbi:hypothetical protein J2X31_002200 [Flavobacterium arsenatis]|uniref:DUF3892 domain-containing protein n=1 Tax=Flavobacterium arsenatis TaxID=1484332 RepID=A0ABU1TQC3_9FLAO|nr:DUF3892 domain-containing protein [Flavobacterium arsenatis]MDR6968185.1 hypothetical protein [Flavobacterium arsenatis]